jgi:hypothetical protein
MEWRCGAVVGIALCAFAAPECGGQAAKAPETAGQWLRRERVRCLSYLSVSAKTEEHVRRTRQMGFNCALSVTGDAPVEKLMPLVNAADKHSLRIIWVSYMINQLVNSPAVAKAMEGDARRFVGADGRVSRQSACPADPLYWKVVMLDRALPLANLAGEGHRSSAGMLFDIEDYAAVGDWSHYCHCDQCFRSFCDATNRADAAQLPPEKRHRWLVENGLWMAYCLHQDAEVVKIFAGIRRRIDQVAPDFLFAFYPWVHVETSARGRDVPWDERLCAGLGTERAPYLIFDEATYVWGYEPRVEAWTIDLKAKGFHFIAVSGFNLVPSERVWWPEQMARSAYYAATLSGGYWFYVGDWVLLREKTDELPPQWGGRQEEWVKEFTHVNRLIAQTISGKPVHEKVPPIPLRPLKEDVRAFQPPDLFDHKHSQGSSLLIRRWTEIGLPWEGGELVLLAKKPGDWFSFERDIRRPDRYQISAWFTTGPNRGMVQLWVGGQPAGEPASWRVDLYAPTTVPMQHRVVARAVLQAGRPRLELRVVGKNERSSGYDIGLTCVGVDRIGWPPNEWNVILPFDNTGENQPGYSAVYPPERETRLDATYTGKDGVPVGWQVVRADEDGYLNFLPLVSDSRSNVGYALVYVHCPTDAMRSILLGSDDGGKLWVNDEFVWGENMPRSAQRDEDRPMAFFRAGWNKVLAKITQSGGSWGLYFRIYDPENTLRYSLRPEGR